MSPNRSDESYVEISSLSEVRVLASHILSLERDYPIIALTARANEQTPTLSIERMRRIIGPGVPIYFIPSRDLALQLRRFLPKALTVSGGAGRLWWPGFTKDSRPQDHPKFYDVSGDYPDAVYEWLEAEFRPPPEPRLMPRAQGFADPHWSSCRSHNERRTSIGLLNGIKILSHFVGGHPMGHTELAHRVGISRSVAHRRLWELAALGYLIETRERRYRLAGATESLRT